MLSLMARATLLVARIQLGVIIGQVHFAREVNLTPLLTPLLPVHRRAAGLSFRTVCRNADAVLPEDPAVDTDFVKEGAKVVKLDILDSGEIVSGKKVD